MGVGVSYKTAADLHEEDLRKDGGQHGIYDYVYSSTRPEIFSRDLIGTALATKIYSGSETTQSKQ